VRGPLPPKTTKSLPPRAPIARDANTAVDLDIAKIDDRPTPRAGMLRPAAPRAAKSRPPLPPLSARTTTLIFHGAPPPPPPSPVPTRPSHDAITPRMIIEDVSTSELIDAEDDDREEGAEAEADSEVEKETPLAPRARTAPPPPDPGPRTPSLLAPEVAAFLSPLARWRRKVKVSWGTVACAAVGVAQVAAIGAGIAWLGAAVSSVRAPVRALALAPAPAPALALAHAPSPGDGAIAGCRVAAGPRLLAGRAVVGAGVEAAAADARVALAAITGPREARAVELDPSSLAALSTARLVLPWPPRRAVPLLAAGEPLDVAVDDTPRARTMIDATGAPFPIDARRGDAVRGARLDGEVIVAARRAGAVWLERGKSPPLRLSGDAKQVGAPSLSARDGIVAAAWAQRATAGAPWRIRFAEWRSPASPSGTALPDSLVEGDAMSPAIAVLDEEGRVLLAWTDGKLAQHSVRTILLDAAGTPLGPVVTVSPPGANAGQPQIALAEGGRAIVGFFASGATKGTFGVYATALACSSAASPAPVAP
jgi:hypothetical protein